MGVVDRTQVIRFLREKQRRRQERLGERFDRAQEDSRRIVSMIAEKYHPSRIYRWGSLLQRKHFSERSDIDIAVEGIRSPETWFALCGEAMRMTDFPLDIVELERIEPEFRVQIEEYGELAYERPDRNLDADRDHPQK